MPGPFNHCHLHCQPAAIQQTEDEHALDETVTFLLHVVMTWVCVCVCKWWRINHIPYTLGKIKLYAFYVVGASENNVLVYGTIYSSSNPMSVDI